MTLAAGESDPAAFLFERTRKSEFSTFILIDCKLSLTTLSNLREDYSMKPMSAFQLVVGSILLSELGKLAAKEIKERSVLNNAIRRVRNAPDLCRILPRSQALELMKFGIHARELMEVREAVRHAVDNFSMDLQEQVDYFTSLLRPDRRAPEVREEERGRNAESELDRWLDVLPPNQKGPSFFFVGPPDPQDALGGIASQDKPAAPPVHERTRTRGEVTQVERSSTDSSGNTKVITETYISGELVGIVINRYNSRGSLTHEAREYHIEVEDTHGRWEHRVGSDRYHLSWRYGDEIGWRNGLPPGNPRDWPHRGRPAPMRFPLDDSAGGVPHFFLKLPNGGYAMCYVTNPAAGLSYCTLLSRDQVNIQEGVAPMIEATNLIVHPDDLVMNPDPNHPLVQQLPTREEVERRFERPDPGPRTPVPNLT